MVGVGILISNMCVPISGGRFISTNRHQRKRQPAGRVKVFIKIIPHSYSITFDLIQVGLYDTIPCCE